MGLPGSGPFGKGDMMALPTVHLAQQTQLKVMGWAKDIASSAAQSGDFDADTIERLLRQTYSDMVNLLEHGEARPDKGASQ